MKNKEKHILFVSHLATRSGAPILLLEVIKAWKEQHKQPFFILCMEEGELLPEFKKLGKTFVWKKKPYVIENRVLAKCLSLLNRCEQVIHGFRILRKLKNTGLVFYNTIGNEHIQKKLTSIQPRSICYVHEMEAVIYMVTSKKGREFVLTNTSFFLSVSEAVKANLVTNFNVDKNKIKVVATPMNEVNRDKQHYQSLIEKFKRENAIGDATIVGITGTNEWRKGIDFLVPLVNLYFQKFPQADTYFVWKGFRTDQYNSFNDLFDIKKCPYKKRILLLPHDAESIAQMASFDIHLLLSREDPYPLVVLEAASFGIPTICFADAGGTPEFVEEDCGFVVPYANLDTMAEKIYTLSQDKELREEMGFNCRKKMLTKHDKRRSLAEIMDNMVLISKQ